MRRLYAAAFLISISCAGMATAGKETAKGTIIGLFAWLGSFFGPAGTVIGSLFSFLAVKLAEKDEAVEAAVDNAGNSVKALGLYDSIALFLGQWGLAIVVVLLVILVLKWGHKLNKVEKFTGIDIDRDGDVGEEGSVPKAREIEKVRGKSPVNRNGPEAVNPPK